MVHQPPLPPPDNQQLSKKTAELERKLAAIEKTGFDLKKKLLATIDESKTKKILNSLRNSK